MRKRGWNRPEEQGSSLWKDAFLRLSRNRAAMFSLLALALIAALPVKGIAHITGGGIAGNLPRVLPEAVKAVIDQSRWPRPLIFQWLQSEGRVAESEMQRVFNCGIGMAVVVAKEHVEPALRLLREAGEYVVEIGCIDDRKGGEPRTIIV